MSQCETNFLPQFITVALNTALWFGWLVPPETLSSSYIFIVIGFWFVWGFFWSFEGDQSICHCVKLIYGSLYFVTNVFRFLNQGFVIPNEIWISIYFFFFKSEFRFENDSLCGCVCLNSYFILIKHGTCMFLADVRGMMTCLLFELLIYWHVCNTIFCCVNLNHVRVPRAQCVLLKLKAH